MPPKKQQKSNGFMIFTLEWKQKYGRKMAINKATEEAGKIWANMDASQRAPYNEKAKEERMLTSRTQAAKLTCTGTPISQVEKERMDSENKERFIKREIEATVSKSVRAGKLEQEWYYFIMVNYFTKTLKGGIYIPAELAVCKFSLKDGVHNIYQTAINPVVNIYGHLYDAQQHSDTTHNLPLPPKAIGEKNLAKIYNSVLDFIRDDSSNNYPPVYTLRDSIYVVESVLKFLQADEGSQNIELKVYPIQYLFYIMKEATCDVGELEKPNVYITDAYFERDNFEFQVGIACQFHEEIDKNKYCTESYVVRWGFMFGNYMCNDLALPLIPGKHCPAKNDTITVINPVRSISDDTESFVSMSTNMSDDTQAVAGSRIYYDEKKKKANYTVDFPSLSGWNVKKNLAICPSYQGENTTRNPNASNPWTLRSRNVPKQPDTSDFDMDFPNDAVKSYPSIRPSSQGQKSTHNFNDPAVDDVASNPWPLLPRNLPKQPGSSQFHNTKQPDISHFDIGNDASSSDTDDYMSVKSFEAGGSSMKSAPLSNTTAIKNYGRGRGRGHGYGRGSNLRH